MNAVGTAAEAVGERATGRQVSRTKSIFTAVIAGVAAATLTYRLLRSGSAPEDES